MSIPFAPDADARIRRVFVRGLTVLARLGVYPHEQVAPQRLILDIELAVTDDHAPDGIGPDRLTRVVDYAAVVAAARRIVAEGHTRLVETLAERIAVAALDDPRVLAARVTAAKPDILHDAASVGVTVERRRADPGPPPAP